MYPIKGKTWRLGIGTLRHSSRRSQWHKLIFGVSIKIQENQKLHKKLLDGGGQKWV